MKRGTSADRQLEVYEKARAAGASEKEAPTVVVDWLIERDRGRRSRQPDAKAYAKRGD